MQEMAKRYFAMINTALERNIVEEKERVKDEKNGAKEKLIMDVKVEANHVVESN